MASQLYLALGDSITCGYHATHPTRTYVHQVTQYLRAEQMATAANVIARNGWTSHQLLHALQTLPRPLLEQTHIATVLIGGNNLRRQYYRLFGHTTPLNLITHTVESFSASVARICETLARGGVQHVFLGTIYNPFPNAPIVTHAIDAINHAIRKQANEYGCVFVDVFPLFDRSQNTYIQHYRTGTLADMATPFRRPIHPNDAGHTVIATAFVRHVRERFATL